jgi:hypothetical protein
MAHQPDNGSLHGHSAQAYLLLKKPGETNNDILQRVGEGGEGGQNDAGAGDEGTCLLIFGRPLRGVYEKPRWSGGVGGRGGGW